MTVRYLTPPPEANRRSFDAVFERAVAAGASAPAWVTVAEDAGWLRAAATRPRSERSRGVVVASAVATLVAAHRLGIGGAISLPPSTPAAATAFATAAATAADVDDGLDPADLAAESSELVVVVAHNPALWRRQLGAPYLRRALAALADRLEVPWCCGPGPSLLVAGCERAVVAAACTPRATDPTPGQGWQVTTVAVGAGGLDLDRALGELVGRSADGGERPRRCPVYSLPAGNRVGWWVAGSGAGEPVGVGWVATPERPNRVGFRWRLASMAGEPRWVEDVVADEGQPGASGVVRVPGWLTAGLCAGACAAPVVEHLAAAAAAAGGVLWVANVDRPALELLLSWRLPLWVDGPAVPEG